MSSEQGRQSVPKPAAVRMTAHQPDLSFSLEPAACREGGVDLTVNTGEVQASAWLWITRSCELWTSAGLKNENHPSFRAGPARQTQLEPLAGLRPGY